MKQLRALMLVSGTVIAAVAVLYPRSRVHRQRVRLARAILEVDTPAGWKFWDFFHVAALGPSGLSRMQDTTDRVKRFLAIAESRELVMPWGADESALEPMNRRWVLTDKGRDRFRRLAAA